jgi:hypothetical protein
LAARSYLKREANLQPRPQRASVHSAARRSPAHSGDRVSDTKPVPRQAGLIAPEVISLVERLRERVARGDHQMRALWALLRAVASLPPSVRMTASAKRPRGDGPSTEARLTGLLGIQTGHRPARCGSSGSSSDARRRKWNESKETMTDKMVTMPPDVWRLSGKISKPFRWFTVLSKDK